MRGEKISCSGRSKTAGRVEVAVRERRRRSVSPVKERSSRRQEWESSRPRGDWREGHRGEAGRAENTSRWPNVFNLPEVCRHYRTPAGCWYSACKYVVVSRLRDADYLPQVPPPER